MEEELHGLQNAGAAGGGGEAHAHATDGAGAQGGLNLEAAAAAVAAAAAGDAQAMFMFEHNMQQMAAAAPTALSNLPEWVEAVEEWLGNAPARQGKWTAAEEEYAQAIHVSALAERFGRKGHALIYRAGGYRGDAGSWRRAKRAPVRCCKVTRGRPAVDASAFCVGSSVAPRGHPSCIPRT